MDEDEQPSFVIKKKGRGNKGTSRAKPTEQITDSQEAENDLAESVVKRSLAKKDRKSLSSVTAASPTGSAKSARTFLRQPSHLGETGATTNDDSQKASYTASYLDELKQSQTQSPARTSYSNLALAKYGQSALSKYDSLDSQDAAGEEQLIPTTNAIAAAKLKRGLLRKLGDQQNVENGQHGNDDFISLEVATYGSHGYKGGESRLVREEDELGEGDDDAAEYTGAQDRVALGRTARKEAERKRREGMLDLINDAQEQDPDSVMATGDEDDEMRDWENAQLRRGGYVQSEMDVDETRTVYKPAPIPEVMAVPSMASVQARLQQQLQHLEREHEANQAILRSSEAELADLDKQEVELRKEVERISDANAWFTGMRDWVEDVAAFLDAKFPLVEKIEADNIAIQRERFEMVQRRRFSDDADDIALFTGATTEADYDMYLKSKRLSAEEGQAAKDGAQVDVELDKLQDAISRDPKSAMRQSRRTERDRRFNVAKQSKPDLEDGYETDDQLTLEATEDLHSAFSGLEKRKEAIFDDVEADSFLDPAKGILSRFREWRQLHSEEYAKSYAGLTMVNVWEFWARVEACTWNPFEIKGVPNASNNLEAFSWHSVLTDYAHESATATESVQEDENIVGALVADVIMPRLQALAVGYDPYSSRATTRALHLCEEITYCVDKNGRKFEVLLQAFLKQIQSAVQVLADQLAPHLSLLESPQIPLDVSGIQARQRYCMRLIKLLATGLRWKRLTKNTLLPAGIGLGSTLEQMLATELVEKLLLPLLEADWQNNGERNAERVLSLFSKSFALSPAATSRLRRAL